MDVTIFAQILKDMVDAIPGACGAIFIDWEGEAVDSFSLIEGSDIRLAGAHWGIVYNQARRTLGKLGLGAPRELVLRFEEQQVIIRRVADGYLAIITMEGASNLGRALGLMRWAEQRLREEM